MQRNPLPPLAGLALGLALAGCTTSSGTSVIALTDAGHRVLIDEARYVRGCRRLGEVEAPPPRVLADDVPDTLRNGVALLGGDTLVYADLRFGSGRGIAYRCGARTRRAEGRARG